MTATVSKLDGSTSAASGSGTDFGGGVSLAYNAATGAYTVRDANGLTQSFAPSDITGSNAAITAYNKTSGSVSDDLVLFNPGASNSRMALSYVSYGAWQRVTDNGATLDVTEQFFVYGIRQAANQPSTGSGSYTTIVDGLWTNPNGVYSLAGTSSFTADFGARTVATTIDLAGTNVVTNAPLAFGRFDGTGAIAALGGGFSGTFAQVGAAGDGNVYTGGFKGAFFGPAGQEVGYTFSLTAPGGAATGAVVGKAQ